MWVCFALSQSFSPLEDFTGELHSEQPHNRIYEFNGFMWVVSINCLAILYTVKWTMTLSRFEPSLLLNFSYR